MPAAILLKAADRAGIEGAKSTMQGPCASTGHQGGNLARQVALARRTLRFRFRMTMIAINAHSDTIAHRSPLSSIMSMSLAAGGCESISLKTKEMRAPT
jgi:hypothetical protein